MTKCESHKEKIKTKFPVAAAPPPQLPALFLAGFESRVLPGPPSVVSNMPVTDIKVWGSTAWQKRGPGKPNSYSLGTCNQTRVQL